MTLEQFMSLPAASAQPTPTVQPGGVVSLDEFMAAPSAQDQGAQLAEFVQQRVAQQEQQLGRFLTVPEKVAITDAARQLFMGAAPLQTPIQAEAQVRQQATTTTTPLENFAGSAAQTLAGYGTGLVGVVDPETGARLERGLGYTYDPKSKSVQVGSAVGNTLASLAASGIPGGHLLLGATSAGSFRNRVNEIRSQYGKDAVSAQAELIGAAAYGAAEAAFEKFSLGGIQRISQAALKGQVKNFLLQYAKQAGIEYSEEFLTQIAQDSVDAYIGGPLGKEAREGGVSGFLSRAHEAGKQGALAGLLGAGGAHIIGAASRRGPVNQSVPPPAQQQLPTRKLEQFRVISRERETQGQEVQFPSLIEKAQHIVGRKDLSGPVVEEAKQYLAQQSVQAAANVPGTRVEVGGQVVQPQASVAPGTSVPATAAKIEQPVPTQPVRDLASTYTKSAGIEYNPDTTYASVDESRATRIAEWYEQGKHEPNSPEVKASYDALKKETKAQYEQMVQAGYKIEPWTNEGQAYKSSKDMIKDVSQNKHLWYDPTFKTGFGQTEVPDHPMMEMTEVNGQQVPFNDLFRAVHDFFGHAKEGVGFGPRGEENAWRQHSQMYSPLARPSMTTETRGQNSWVNFGPFGKENRANPKNTKFADQKAMLAPAWVVNEGAPGELRPEKLPQGPLQQQQGRARTRLSEQAEVKGQKFSAQERDILRQQEAERIMRGEEPSLNPVKIPGTNYGYWFNGKEMVPVSGEEGHENVARNVFDVGTNKAIEKGNVRVVADGKGTTTIEAGPAGIPNVEKLKGFISRELRNQQAVIVEAAGDFVQLIPTKSLSENLSRLERFLETGGTSEIGSTRTMNPRQAGTVTDEKITDAIIAADNWFGKDFIPAPPRNKEQADIGKSFGKLFGGRIVWYEGKGSGFAIPDFPGILFLNSRLGNKGVYHTLAHEMMHALAVLRPKLFQQFQEALPKKLRTKYMEQYLKIWQEGGFEGIPPRLTEEALTQPFAELAEDRRMMAIFRGENPSLYDKVVDFFRFLGRRISNFVGGRPSPTLKAWGEAFKIWENLLNEPLYDPNGYKPSVQYEPSLAPTATEPTGRAEQNKAKAIDALIPEDKFIWNRLLPEEKQWINAPGVARVAKAYREVQKSMPSEQWQAAIRAGMPMRKWYQKATTAIKQVFGEDAPLFTSVLAATSPRQPVIKNLQMTLKMWEAWTKAGRPTDKETITKIVAPLAGMSTRVPNAVRAFAGEYLSGPKVNSFGQNLLGNLNFVTNDTWMAQFSGLNEEFFGDNARYAAYSAVVREEAKKAGIEPAEAQAAVWSFFSVLANSVNSTTLGRDALTRLTGEKVANANQFDFISDPSIRESLRQAGYSEDAIAGAAKAAEAIVATDNAKGGISPADVKTLEPIADRAQQVARRPVNVEKVAEREAEMGGGQFAESQLPPAPEASDEIPFNPARPDEERGPRKDLSLRSATEEGRGTYVAEDIEREKQGEPKRKSDIETNAAAEKIVARGDPAIHELIKKAESGQTFDDDETVAVQKFVDTRLPEAIKNKSLNEIALIGQLITADRKAGTEAGRAFRQRRDPITPAEHVRNTLAEAMGQPPVEEGEPTPSKSKRVEHLKRIKKHLIERGMLDQMTEENMKDPIWVSKVLNEISTLDPEASPLYEYWMASILSGFETQERNFIGNLVNMAVKQPILRPVEMLINQFVKNPQAAQYGEWKYIFKGMGSRLMQAWANAVASFRAERPIMFGRFVGSKADLSRGPQIRGTKGKIIRTPLRVLTAVDQFMKTVAGTGEAAIRAFRDGKAQGMAPGSQQMEDYIKAQLADFDSPAWQEAYAYATGLAFQNKPGEFISSLARLRETLKLPALTIKDGKLARTDIRPLRYVFPFLRIASALESATWRLTPFGSLRVGYRGLTGAYQNNSQQAITDVAEQMMAWAIAASLWAAAGDDDEEGWITGSQSPEQQRLGYHPQSIRIPGIGWVSYKHVQPLSGAVTTVIDSINTIKRIKRGEEVTSALGTFAGNIRDRVKNNTWMQGFADLYDAFQQPDSKGVNYLTNFGASWVPNLLRQPQWQADPVVREARKLGDTGVMDLLERRSLPGVFKAMPRVTSWGKEVTKPGTALERILNPLDRFDESAHKADAVIARYDLQNPQDPYYPSVPSPTLQINDESYKMTEQEYYTFLRLGGLLASRPAAAIAEKAGAEPKRPLIDAIDKIRDQSYTRARELMKAAITKKKAGKQNDYDRIIKRLDEVIARLDK